LRLMVFVSASLEPFAVIREETLFIFTLHRSFFTGLLLNQKMVTTR